MKIKKIKKQFTILSIAVSLLAMGCTKDKVAVDPQKVLYDKFDGFYLISSATTNSSVDINLDGVENIDMLKEYEQLFAARLTFDISKKYITMSSMWEEQEAFYIEYPPIVYKYALKWNKTAFCILNDSLNRITITDTALEQGQNLSFPEDLTISEEGWIKGTIRRTVHTSKGMQELKIAVKYIKQPSPYRQYN